MEEDVKIFDMPDIHITPDDIIENIDLYDGLPIVIDNGSWECRADFASNGASSPRLVFKNMIVRNRGKKDFEMQVGNDIKNIELFRWLIKNQFDRNVITNFDNQETIFDYIFTHLGITNSSVDHPVVMTEPLSNPNYCRQLMSELLFEAYQVPSVAFGVDSLFSYYKSNQAKNVDSGLVISCGYNNTHVIPILHNRLDLNKSQRVNVGGYHMVSYLHRLLQLKYPTHFASITLSRAEELLKRHMMYADNYQDDLNNLNNPEYYAKRVHKIQLLYTPLPGSVPNKPIGKIERCQAMIERLKDIHLKKRSLNLMAKEEKLQQLNMIQELYEERDLDLFQRALREFGFSSLQELQNGMEKLNRHILKVKNSSVTINYDTLDGVELDNFSDIETWILAVRKKWQKFRDLSLEELNQPKKNFKIEDFNSGIENEMEIDVLGMAWDEFEGPEKLQELEDILNEYEGEFNKEHAIGCESSLAFNLAEYYQLHLGVERTRVPEIIFQPSMIGVDQAGLAEVTDNILKTYSNEDRNLLANNVFLTGGCSSLPGFISRLNAELREMLPFKSIFQVSKADSGVLNPWQGACIWSLKETNKSFFVTKSEYEEKGGDYLKENFISNVYIRPQQLLKTLSVILMNQKYIIYILWEKYLILAIVKVYNIKNKMQKNSRKTRKSEK